MNVFKTALQALGEGALTLETDGTYELLFITGDYTVDLDDDGDEFEDDLGANISHRETLSNVAWVDRVLDADDVSITDPDNEDTVTQVVIVKSGNGEGGAGGGGTASTNRLICHQTLASSVSWDGTNDSFVFHASGIFRLGSA